jgi:hypothetical protein
MGLNVTVHIYGNNLLTLGSGVFCAVHAEDITRTGRRVTVVGGDEKGLQCLGV